LIRAFDVAYFMISVDTLEDNTAFAKKEEADFPLLADPTKETARKYGVLADMSRFNIGEVASRWTFYIGPDGKILDIDKKVNPAQSGEDIVTHLKALKVPAAKNP
jgi:thioredoxin-dependent peroxiredoxin